MNKNPLALMESQGTQILGRPTLAISPSLSALPCIFIMSTGSLALHYIKWDLGFVLLFSSKNQKVPLIPS